MPGKPPRNRNESPATSNGYRTITRTALSPSSVFSNLTVTRALGCNRPPSTRVCASIKNTLVTVLKLNVRRVTVNLSAVTDTTLPEKNGSCACSVLCGAVESCANVLDTDVLTTAAQASMRTSFLTSFRVA